MTKYLLLFPYVIFPVVSLVSERYEFELNRNLILDAPIFLIGFIIAPLVIVQKRKFHLLHLKLILFGISMVIYVAVRDTILGLPELNMSLVFSLKPAAYFIVTGLILLAWGPPEIRDYIRFGRVLSIIIIAYFLLQSVMHKSIIRPDFTQDINYEALLIFLSFGLLIAERTGFSAAKFHIIGMMATFSRTVMAAILVFSLAEIKIRKLIQITLLTGVAALIFYFSFVIRSSSVELESVDRYSMLLTFFDWVEVENPSLYFGSSGGNMHNVIIPPQISQLVDSQNVRNELNGFYSFNLHSFLLRFIVDYGLIGFFALLAFIYSIIKNFSKLHKVLIICLLFVGGASTGIIYLSNFAFPFITLFASIHMARTSSRLGTARRTQRHQTSTKNSQVV